MDWRDLTRTQAGVITRTQLADCGASEGVIRGLVKRGDVVSVLPGVYAARPVADTFIRRAWAAALWSGGIVSHASAAQLWELPARLSTAIHVIVERPVHRKATGVRLHRPSSAGPLTTNFDGLHVTTRTTTIIDLLRSEPHRDARDLFDRSLQQGWLDVAAAHQAALDGRGLAGNAQLRMLLCGIEPGAQAESERLLHRLLKRAAITGWVPQYRVRIASGFAYIDVAFPERMLAVEVEGRLFHDERSDRFESDRRRSNELTALGWRVLRVTWQMLSRDPAEVAAKIRLTLAA
jgi:very-short-patch-repair endonuclease